MSHYFASFRCLPFFLQRIPRKSPEDSPYIPLLFLSSSTTFYEHHSCSDNNKTKNYYIRKSFKINSCVWLYHIAVFNICTLAVADNNIIIRIRSNSTRCKKGSSIVFISRLINSWILYFCSSAIISYRISCCRIIDI